MGSRNVPVPEVRSPYTLWIKDLSVARHQAWRSAGKVVMLRIHEIIPDQHRHQDWPKSTLHASYAHVAHIGYGTLLERIGQREI